MIETYEQATRQIASYVNQGDGKMFGETELLAYVNAAQRWVFDTFAEQGATQVRAASGTISLPAVNTSMTLLTTPALPTGFLAPIEVYELVDSSWIQILSKEIPQNYTADTRRSFWDWYSETLWFPAATVATSIRLVYVTRDIDLTMPRDTLALQGVLDAICYYAAADASTAIEKFERAQAFRSLAQMRLESASIVDVHIRQQRPFRQRSWRSGFQIGRRW